MIRSLLDLFGASERRPQRRYGLMVMILSIGLMSVAVAPLSAQLGLGGKGSAPDTSVPTAVSLASPRVSLENFLRLAEAGNWAEAADYLVVPSAEQARAAVLARRLKVVLDQRLDLKLADLSPLAVGDTTDGDRQGDVIGAISVGARDVSVRLVRATSGTPHWQFAASTVEHVDVWFNALGAPFLRDRLPETMMREGPLDVFYWQWLAIAVLLPLIIVFSWVLGAILRRVTGYLARSTVTEWDDLLLENLRGPFRLWAGAILSLSSLAFLELNPRVDGFLTALVRGLALLALFWALLRVIGLVQRRLVQSALASGQGAQARTLVPLLSNILRVTVAVIALLVALSQFGYPVTTLLAGLGIGGIAVALAAQKTVEHLFGSVSLAADRVFRVGDWVRVGTLEGEVERIGLRSTSIRTIERTVVRVPNGRLADDRIETFGERDRMVFRTDIDLTYDTTPEQFVAIRGAIESALRAHPAIWPDRVRVYLTGFGESAIRLNVTCWFQTTDVNDFVQYRHDMMLTFMRIVKENGSSFAFPSRTVYHVGANGQPLPPMVD
ncbi:MAG: mechanosensitive ion channel family protein [Gemmatimonadaceae bacterium]|nr:mechanosensitive ion channel family protein [Gemmatimonadaceae bacterium]